MSDQTIPALSTLTDEPSKGIGVLARVAERLAASGAESLEAVVDSLVSQEKERRVKVLLAAVDHHSKLEFEVRKAENSGRKKPAFTLDAAGNRVSAPVVYSDDELKAWDKAKKTANDKLDLFERLFNEAVTKPSDDVFKKLEKAMKGEDKKESDNG